MSINGSNNKALGWRIGEAVEFLVNLLAGKELPSEEVLRLAREAGILDRTLSRAKQIVNAKSHRKQMKWYTSVPAEMKERTFSITTRPRKEYLLQPVKNWSISSDWVSVTPRNDSGAGYQTDISSRLRVKVGQYEFEADENFPADKLAELLRGLLPHGADAAGTPGLAVASE